MNADSTQSSGSCPACGRAGEGPFCTACGASIPPRCAPETPEVETLLARANLHRIRSQWEDAEKACVDVLRRDPNNVHAHSLLGDIYRERGRLDDAAQWYRLALDLNPASATDRAKLAQVEGAAASRTRQPAALDSPAPGTQKLMGLPPSTWVRALTAASVVCLVVALGVALAARGRRPAADTVSGTVRDPLTTTRPATGAGPPLPAPAAPVPASPVPAAPGTPPLASRGAGPAGPSVPSPPVPTPPAPAGVAREQELATYIAQRAGLEAGTTVASVRTGRTGQAAQVVLSRASRPADPAVFRASILPEAYRAGRVALEFDPTLQSVLVGVQALGADGNPALVFSGRMDRQALAQPPPDATTEALLGAFTEVWWAPSLSLSGPADSQSAEAVDPNEGFNAPPR